VPSTSPRLELSNEQQARCSSGLGKRSSDCQYGTEQTFPSMSLRLPPYQTLAYVRVHTQIRYSTPPAHAESTSSVRPTKPNLPARRSPPFPIVFTVPLTIRTHPSTSHSPMKKGTARFFSRPPDTHGFAWKGLSGRRKLWTRASPLPAIGPGAATRRDSGESHNRTCCFFSKARWPRVKFVCEPQSQLWHADR